MHPPAICTVAGHTLAPCKAGLVCILWWHPQQLVSGETVLHWGRMWRYSNFTLNAACFYLVIQTQTNFLSPQDGELDLRASAGPPLPGRWCCSMNSDPQSNHLRRFTQTGRFQWFRAHQCLLHWGIPGGKLTQLQNLEEKSSSVKHENKSPVTPAMRGRRQEVKDPAIDKQQML